MVDVNLVEDNVSGLFEAISKGYKKGLNRSLAQRKKHLRDLLKWVLKYDDRIKEAVYADFKKPAGEVDITEIFPVVSEIRHALNNLTHWVSPEKVDAPLSLLGTTSYIQYEPKGASLIIAPWNYPFNLCAGPLVSCLAAGNTAIIKPSEMTPHTSTLVAEMVSEIFDPEVVSVVKGEVETSQALLTKPFNHIFFTGSPDVGKIVMQQAAKNLTSVTLELGGKSPTIVDEKCNLKDAAEKIAWGKFINNGQTCLAPDYVIVHENVVDSFLQLLSNQVSLLFKDNGGSYKTSNAYGRLVNRNHFNRITNLMQEAIDKGAKVVISGEFDEAENYVAPVILRDIDPSSKVMEEEIFGPILPILTYSDLQEVTDLINSKTNPLVLYYFGNSKKNYKRLLNETSSGNVCINDCLVHFGHTNLPFGGVNHSGMGKAHGKYGFMEFSNAKGVLKQRVGITATKFIFPPYTSITKRIIILLKKYL